jgi:hypothetical protein
MTFLSVNQFLRIVAEGRRWLTAPRFSISL